MNENLIDLEDRVRLVRLGGLTERAHIVPHQGSYNVAQHSWGVAMLMLQLWPEDFPRLAAYCICHDVPEAWIGDVPAHTKARSPRLTEELAQMEVEICSRLQIPDEHELHSDDLAKLKACDALELYLWAQEQVLLANHHAGEIIHKLDVWFQTGNHRALPPPAYELYERLRTARIVDKSRAMEEY